MTKTLNMSLKEQLKELTETARQKVSEYNDAQLLAEGIAGYEELLEATQESLNHFSLVDPLEKFIDPNDDFTYWYPVNSFNRSSRTSNTSGLADPLLHGSFDYTRMRQRGRVLALRNEYAINIIENMINFVVGKGLAYLAVTKPTLSQKKKSNDRQFNRLEVVQQVIDDFIFENDWDELEQELVKRSIRDGEFFLMFFPQVDGTMVVRTIEPEEIFTPDTLTNDKSVSFGIKFDDIDRQLPIGYYINNKFVEAGLILHRKFNVDRSIARGVSGFYAVDENLQRAEKLMRNMSRVAAVQAALIGARQFENSSKAAVERMIKGKSVYSHTDRLKLVGNSSGSTVQREFMKWNAPTMLNMPKGQKFEFFTKAIAADSFIPVLAQELRGIASRFQFPEFMLTSDASNGNFASTMVAETPFVKSMERRQGRQTKVGERVVKKVLQHSGVWSLTVGRTVKINVEAPNLIIRDNRKEAQANMIKAEAGILSPQTWSQKEGLCYKVEQNNIKEHVEQFGQFPASNKQMDKVEDEVNDERRDRETTGEDEGR